MKKNRQGVRDLNSVGGRYSGPKQNRKHQPPINEMGICMNRECKECVSLLNQGIEAWRIDYVK